jgi:hypothetical protein
MSEPTFYDLQRELEVEMNALRARGHECEKRLSNPYLVSSDVMKMIAAFGISLQDLADSMSGMFRGFDTKIAGFGYVFLTTPAEKRRSNVSDWLFNLHYRTGDKTDVWFLTYYPARAWEWFVYKLPIRLFQRKGDD